jgi:hypothetical protein
MTDPGDGWEKPVSSRPNEPRPLHELTVPESDVGGRARQAGCGCLVVQVVFLGLWWLLGPGR